MQITSTIRVQGTEQIRTVTVERATYAEAKAEIDAQLGEGEIALFYRQVD